MLRNCSVINIGIASTRMSSWLALADPGSRPRPFTPVSSRFDECFLACRDPRAVIKRTANSAYPKVISNLGSLSDTMDGKVAINMIRFMNHYARSVKERALIIKFFKENTYVSPTIFSYDSTGARNSMELTGSDAFKDWPDGVGMKTSAFMGMMNDYFAVGFSNTIGYAHANTGDTMTSVMIGGLRTVKNGDFEIFPGDLVQFYWYSHRLFRVIRVTRV